MKVWKFLNAILKEGFWDLQNGLKLKICVSKDFNKPYETLIGSSPFFGFVSLL